MFPDDGLEGLCVAVQLLLTVRQMHQRHHREQHPLVTGGQVVQHLAGLLPLLLQVIGNNGGEVVVAVLPALPVGHIGLHPQQAVLQLPHGLVGWDGDDVDGQHQVPVQAGQLVDHGVLDVAGVLLEEQHPAILVPHDEVVLLKFQAVRADSVLEGVAAAHTLPQIQAVLRLLAGAVEVVEHPQALHRVQLLAVGVQMIQPGGHIVYHPVKEGAGLFHALAVDGQGDIPLLGHAVGGVGDLVHEHGVVLGPVAVQRVILPGQQDLPFKVLPVDPLIVDGDLGGGPSIQRVEQLGVVQEHGRLVLFGCDGVVDVAEPQGLGEFVSELKNPIRPEAADGDGVLYGFRHLECLFVLL